MAKIGRRGEWPQIGIGPGGGKMFGGRACAFGRGSLERPFYREIRAAAHFYEGRGPRCKRKGKGRKSWIIAAPAIS